MARPEREVKEPSTADHSMWHVYASLSQYHGMQSNHPVTFDASPCRLPWRHHGISLIKKQTKHDDTWFHAMANACWSRTAMH